MDGSNDITLAFSVDALRKFKDIQSVVESAQSWSENIGFIGDSKPLQVKDIALENGITVDFDSGNRSASKAVEDSFHLMATDRHILITGDSELADEAVDIGWEHLTPEESAQAADWELKENTTAVSGDDIEFDPNEINTDRLYEIDMPTNRWHQITRGDVSWITNVIHDDEETALVDEGDVVIISRGEGDPFKFQAQVEETETVDEIEEITDTVPLAEYRPKLDEEEQDTTERLEFILSDAVEYQLLNVSPIEDTL